MITPDTDTDALAVRIADFVFSRLLKSNIAILDRAEVLAGIQEALAYEKSKVDPNQLKLNIEPAALRGSTGDVPPGLRINDGSQGPYGKSTTYTPPDATIEYNAIRPTAD